MGVGSGKTWPDNGGVNKGVFFEEEKPPEAAKGPELIFDLRRKASIREEEIAKFKPSLLSNLKVTIPKTQPLLSSIGPPEFPGLIDASI